MENRSEWVKLKTELQRQMNITVNTKFQFYMQNLRCSFKHLCYQDKVEVKIYFCKQNYKYSNLKWPARSAQSVEPPGLWAGGRGFEPRAGPTPCGDFRHSPLFHVG